MFVLIALIYKLYATRKQTYLRKKTSIEIMNNNKFFYTTFIFYSLLHQILFETTLVLNEIERNIEANTEFIFSPVGRLFRHLLLNKEIEIYSKADMYVFFFNIFICAILYIISFSWFTHFNTLKTYLKLLFTFTAISFLTWFLITWNGIGLGTIGLFIIPYLIPMTILVILTVPFYVLMRRFNKSETEV